MEDGCGASGMGGGMGGIWVGGGRQVRGRRKSGGMGATKGRPKSTFDLL